MQQAIQKVVILGGGTSGWLSAALLAKIIGPQIKIELVESEAIGTVGVGEATIPPIRLVNQVLGLNEAEFMAETQATVKLAIKFENWRVKGEGYYHTFGAPGRSMGFCKFHHLWRRAKDLGLKESLWDYDLNYLCATQGKFAQINSKDDILELAYAYHFDAGLYARYLRKFCESIGVVRTEGKVDKVKRHPQSGYVEALKLENGQEVQGDLFIDCSGFRSLLIGQALGVGYDDWTHWLPCDRAVAMPSKRLEKTLPYTRSIAHDAGWQWRIPLQHRNGNGMVYCSRYCSDDEAERILRENLDTEPMGDPNLIRFTTGRRRKQWDKNVVSVGLSSGFLEPLESTSIYLIQSAITRLCHFFPHNGIQTVAQTEYNRQSQVEFEQIRDFLVLHYYVNERNDSEFWRDMQNLDIPDSLRYKIDGFKENGALYRDQNDLFQDSSWLQVMMGQGLMPKDYHPIANSFSEERLMEMLKRIKDIKDEPLGKLPDHDTFLAHFTRQVR